MKTLSIKTLNFVQSNFFILFIELYLIVKFSFLLTNSYIPSNDLPGHILLIDSLVDQLKEGRLFFYDNLNFGGWAAFQFYGFFAHLVTAFIALFASIFCSNAVIFAVNLVIFLSIVLFPVFFLYALSSIVRYVFDEKTSLHNKFFLSGFGACLSYFYLNHDYQWHGIGAAGILNVGLFSQTFSINLFLICIAQVLNLLQGNKKSFAKLTFFSFLLFITHSLTFIYLGLFLFFLFLGNAGYRLKIISSLLLSLLLASFWLLPFFQLSSDYLGEDIYRPKGDIFEIIFRYPFVALFRQLALFVAEKNFQALLLDFNRIIFLVLSILLISDKVLVANRRAQGLVLFFFFSAMVFSSGYIASSIPLGLHYYRFLNYVFLFFLLIVSLPVFSLLATDGVNFLKKVTIVSIVILSLFSSLYFPHYEEDKLSNQIQKGFKTEDLVIKELASLQGKKRVLFSYLLDYQKYPFLSVHYMASELARKHKVETLNGLFLQSAQSYRMPIASASLLNLPMYHTPLLFTDHARLSSQTKIDQLRDYGVTHIVSSIRDYEKISKEPILNSNLSVVRRVEPYVILQIQEQLNTIAKVKKKTVVYLDIAKTLPFHFMQYFFYSNETLYKNYELVEFKRLDPQMLKNADYVVINRRTDSSKGLAINLSEEQVKVNFHFKAKNRFNHYHVWLQHNFELDKYQEVDDFLHQIGLIGALKVKTKDLGRSEVELFNKEASLVFDSNHQTINLNNLAPDSLYRLKYSFFPMWKAKDGSIFRGLNGQMLVKSNSSHLQLYYSVWNLPFFGFGVLISLLSLVAVVFLYRKI